MIGTNREYITMLVDRDPILLTHRRSVVVAEAGTVDHTAVDHTTADHTAEARRTQVAAAAGSIHLDQEEALFCRIHEQPVVSSKLGVVYIPCGG